jgi:peroxiredoxin
MNAKSTIDSITGLLSQQFFLIAFFFFFSVLCFAEIKKNDKAPQIILRDMDNKAVFVAHELKSRPVLVNFFFTACVPCKKEMPELEKLYNTYKDKVGMYLISTDAEGAGAVRPYVNKMKITIPVLIDKYSDVAKLYGIDKYPSMVLIGKNGKVMFVTNGYKEENIEKLEEILKKIK